MLDSLAHSVAERPGTRIAVSNLLGCCAAMRQEYPEAASHFGAALALVDGDPRLHQNMALAKERQQDWAGAEQHWNRFLNLVERDVDSEPSRAAGAERLLAETLRRLATHCTDAERWNEALTYAQALARLRPADKENLERLFHLYSQTGLTDQARQALRQLRFDHSGDDAYPGQNSQGFDSQKLDTLEQMLDEVEHLLKRHPEGDKVEHRTMEIIAGAVSLLEESCTVLSDQLFRLTNEVNHLPRHQVDWSAVHETRREMQGYFARMRQLVSKTSKLARDDSQREKLLSLHKNIDAGIRQSKDLTY
jgi:tetratricopeptide (TPR) repeat protein